MPLNRPQGERPPFNHSLSLPTRQAPGSCPLAPLANRACHLTRLSVLVLLSLSVMAGSVHALVAQSESGGLEEIRLLQEETVSIAVRREQPISEAPSNVYVITDEDIRHSGATDLPTILRRVPGLEVMQTTGADFNVSARGNNQLQANKMLVMVDGRSIFVDAQAIVHWKLLPVTLPEIKRIEVLKGPAAAVYGFNAFDGVINIITKSPEEMKGTTLQVGGGEFGTWSSAAIHAGKQGKFGYRLSVGEDQNQQWRNREALSFRSYKFNVQTEYGLTSISKLVLSGGLVDSNRFDGPLTEISVNAGAPTQGYANLAYERPNFFIRGWWTGYSNTSDSITNPLLNNLVQATDRALSPISKTRANTYNLETQHTVETGPQNRVTYGVNYRHNTLSTNLITQFGREDRLGIYLQDEWQVLESVTVVAGARYDLDTFINPTFSPRAAVLYRPVQDHTFRAAVSVAYRPPTLFENSLDVRAVTTLPPPFPSPPPTTTNGSPNLEPEKIVSYEVGYQGWYLKHRLRARVDLFFNHISNLIKFQSPITVNGREADIYGGEASLEFLATSWLTGFANYAYQEVGQSFTGQTVRAVPRFKINAGLRGEWESGVNGEIAIYHYGAATYPVSQAFSDLAFFGAKQPNPRVGSYNLLNFRVGYRFWQERAEAAVSVFNALNDRHNEHPLGDTIGSRVMGWLTIKY